MDKEIKPSRPRFAFNYDEFRALQAAIGPVEDRVILADFQAMAAGNSSFDDRSSAEMQDALDFQARMAVRQTRNDGTRMHAMNKPNEFNPTTLVVMAGVRYWEDATVNGVEDTGGELIPLRLNDCWNPTIDLATGRIHRWPIGTTASINYKVCDAGEYRLKDENGNLWKYRCDYVPGILAVGGEGYGDYIIMKVNEAGFIQGWKKPSLDPSEWNADYS